MAEKQWLTMAHLKCRMQIFSAERGISHFWKLRKYVTFKTKTLAFPAELPTFIEGKHAATNTLICASLYISLSGEEELMQRLSTLKTEVSGNTDLRYDWKDFDLPGRWQGKKLLSYDICDKHNQLYTILFHSFSNCLVYLPTCRCRCFRHHSLVLLCKFKYINVRNWLYVHNVKFGNVWMSCVCRRS